jgi:hypothetical protein
VDEELEVWSQLTWIVRKWYLIVAFGLLGALLGYGLSLRNPPVYEACAVLSVGLNYDLTEHLAQYEKDLALGKIEGVVKADDVLEAAATALNKKMGDVSVPVSLQLMRKTVRLEQKGSRWELIASGRDPELMAEIANRWAEAAEHALREAYNHALQAKDLEAQLTRNEQILELLRMTETDGSAGNRQIQYLEGVVQDLSETLQGELNMARGMATFVSFEWSQQAEIPDQPSTRSRGEQILAGNLLGLIVGIIAVVITGAYKRRFSSLARDSNGVGLN